MAEETRIPPSSGGEPHTGAPFAWRHRVLLGRAAVLALIVVVILQNVEPTSFDILFWSLPNVPKLVLIIAAMALGASLWEVTRRLLRRL